MEQGRPPVFKVLNAGFLVDPLLSSVGKRASHFVCYYPFVVPYLNICQKFYPLFFHAVLSFSSREGWIEVSFGWYWPLHLFSRESIRRWFRFQGIYWQLLTPLLGSRWLTGGMKAVGLGKKKRFWIDFIYILQYRFIGHDEINLKKIFFFVWLLLLLFLHFNKQYLHAICSNGML